MSDRRGYAELQDVVLDPSFPALDLALRRGRHIDRDDFALYTLLTDAQAHLEAFYRRFGCELVHKADGYYYLLPTGDQLSRRQLGSGDMLVGQALALLYLDPATIERGGRVTAEDVVAQLVVVLGSDVLIRAFNPKLKRRYDERIAQKNVRARVGDAIRHLAALGFVDLGDDGNLVLRPALMRFAEPVRGLSAPAEALAKLIALGEVALVDEASDTTSTTSDPEEREAAGDGSGDDTTSTAFGDDEDEPREDRDAADDDGDADDDDDADADDRGADDRDADSDDRDADSRDRDADADDRDADSRDRDADIDDRFADGHDRFADSPDRRAAAQVRHADVARQADDADALEALAELPELEAAELAMERDRDPTLPLGDLLAPPERPTAAAPAAPDDDDDDPPYVFETDDDDDEDGDDGDAEDEP